MSNRRNLNTLLTVPVFLLAMAGATFAGPSLCPLQVLQLYEYNRSDDTGSEWLVQWEVKSQVTIDSFDYFQFQEWNYNNDGAFEDWYVRSTEEALYGYNPTGPDYLEHQKAPVGTTWSFYQEHEGDDLDYKVIEIVAIEAVTVPYGTFDTAYVHRRYRCVDPVNLSLGKSPDWYEWIVPGTGLVKQVDYWAKEELGQIPPLTMELVGVSVIPAPSAILLASIGVGFVTWLRRRRAL